MLVVKEEIILPVFTFKGQRVGGNKVYLRRVVTVALDQI